MYTTSCGDRSGAGHAAVHVLSMIRADQSIPRFEERAQSLVHRVHVMRTKHVAVACPCLCRNTSVFALGHFVYRGFPPERRLEGIPGTTTSTRDRRKSGRGIRCRVRGRLF